MCSKNISIYAVYDHPKDYPNNWVVREWRSLAGFCKNPQSFASVWDGTHPLGAKVFATLDEARESLPPGLALVERNEDDDPVVFETWI